MGACKWSGATWLLLLYFILQASDYDGEDDWKGYGAYFQLLVMEATASYLSQNPQIMQKLDERNSGSVYV